MSTKSSSKEVPSRKSQVKKSLLSSERVLIGSLLALLLSFVLVAKLNIALTGGRAGRLENHQVIEVAVRGAVSKPGVYPVLSGTSLETVICRARPKKTADLKKFDLNQRIETAQEFWVEELKEITVTLIGEVEIPGEYTFPLGSRIQDIPLTISFTDEVDPSFARRKRVLKNGEILRIPKRTEKKNFMKESRARRKQL